MLTQVHALPAFRRAVITFDAVLFESCVCGVAVAMTFASICHFEFWFLWGVVLGVFFGCLLEAFVGPEGVPWIHLGSFGVPLGDFLESLRVLLAAVGCLGLPLGVQVVPWTSLGASGVISGIFREIMGGLLAQFWAHFWCFSASFLGFVF